MQIRSCQKLMKWKMQTLEMIFGNVVLQKSEIIRRYDVLKIVCNWSCNVSSDN